MTCMDQRTPGAAAPATIMGLLVAAALMVGGPACAIDAEEELLAEAPSSGELSEELIAVDGEDDLAGEVDRVMDPATAADCEGGANGFVDISDSRRGTAVYTRNLGGGTRTILYYGNVGGVQRGWAMIDGDTIPGDLVWMDWTKDNGAHWIQCGPFSVAAIAGTKTSAAQRTSSDVRWRFRACGRAIGFGSVCGPWW
jgi:hypothetical protein